MDGFRFEYLYNELLDGFGVLKTLVFVKLKLVAVIVGFLNTTKQLSTELYYVINKYHSFIGKKLKLSMKGHLDLRYGGETSKLNKGQHNNIMTLFWNAPLTTVCSAFFILLGRTPQPELNVVKYI